VHPSGATVYTVTGYLNGCSNSQTVSVIVYASPSISVLSSDSLVCKNVSVILTPAGALNYSLGSTAFQNTIAVAPAATTVFTIHGSDGNGCAGSQTLLLSVRPQPTVSITSKKLLICQGDSSSLIVHGGQHYSWDNGSAADTLYVKPFSNTTYTVLGFDQFNCSSAATVQVKVSECAGLKDLENDPVHYTCAPNPVHESFAIYFANDETVNVSVYDLNGKLIFNDAYYTSGKQFAPGNFCTGLLIVRIISVTGTSCSLKILKE